MRYIVYGAGGIGGTIGGRLFRSGADVVLIARGAHHDAIATHGLTLRAPAGTEVFPVPVVDHPDRLAIGADDVVVLAVKTQDTVTALEALAPRAHPDVAVVCAQNGLTNERMALRRFRHVHGMSVALPATHLEPGIVECSTRSRLDGARADDGSPWAWGILDVGRVPSGTDRVDEAMAADLAAAGFAATADPTVMDRKAAKLLLMNLGNVLEAACGPASYGSTLLGAARAEAEVALAAAGLHPKLDDETERRTAMALAPIDGRRRGGGSTWQSLTRGGSLEGDHLNGEIVLLGRLHGVPTPVNEGLQRLGWRLTADHLEPGSLDLASVESSILR